MNRKQFVIALLIFSLTAASLSGCATRPAASERPLPSAGLAEAKAKPTVLSVAMLDLETGTDPALQCLESALNIKIKPICIPGDEYKQFIQLWVNTGELPDIFFDAIVCAPEYYNWISQGKIAALPDDLSAYPNLSRYMAKQDFEPIKVNGKFYCIPRNTYDSTDYNLIERPVCYRWDLAQKAGITKEPETWAEFEAMLAAIVEKDPEHTGIGGLTCFNKVELGGLFWLYSNPCAVSDGYGVDYKWIREDGQYIPALFSRNSLPSLILLRRFYDEGLIDNDIPYITGTSAHDKFVEGKFAALLTCAGNESIDRIYRNQWKKRYSDDPAVFYEKVKFLKPLIGADGKRYHAVFHTYWSESYLSGSMSVEKTEMCLRLFDYMNSNDFFKLRMYGLEGIDYVTSGDRIVKTDESVVLREKYTAFAPFSVLLDWGCMDSLRSDYSGVTAEGHNAINGFIGESIAISDRQEFVQALTYVSTPTKDKFLICDNDDMIRVMLSRKPVEVIWGRIVDEYNDAGLQQMIGEVNAKAAEMNIK